MATRYQALDRFVAISNDPGAPVCWSVIFFELSAHEERQHIQRIILDNTFASRNSTQFPAGPSHRLLGIQIELRQLPALLQHSREEGRSSYMFGAKLPHVFTFVYVRTF